MKAILRLTYLCLSLLFLSLTASAQDVQVKGQVVDDKGEAVIGASVKVKETPQGVITDINGNFSVRAPKNGHLIVSSVGYATKTVALSGATLPLKIVLSESAENLKEVVVVGYGSMQKKDLTGSVSTLNAKNFQKGAISTASDLLVGKSRGVQITPRLSWGWWPYPYPWWCFAQCQQRPAHRHRRCAHREHRCIWCTQHPQLTQPSGHRFDERPQGRFCYRYLRFARL